MPAPWQRFLLMVLCAMQLLLGTDALPSFDTTPPQSADSRPPQVPLVDTGTDPHMPLPQGMASELGWGSPSRPRSALPAQLQHRESRGEHRLHGQLTPISGVVSGLVDAAMDGARDPSGEAPSATMRLSTPGSVSDAAAAQPSMPGDDESADAGQEGFSSRPVTPGSLPDAAATQPSMAESDVSADARQLQSRPVTPGSLPDATQAQSRNARNSDSSSTGLQPAGDMPAATTARPAGTPVSTLVAGLVNDAAARGRPISASMRPTTPGGLSAAAEQRQRMTPVGRVVDSLVEDAIFDETPSTPGSLSSSPRELSQYQLERPRTAGGLSAQASFTQQEHFGEGLPEHMQATEALPTDPNPTSSQALTVDDDSQDTTNQDTDESPKQPGLLVADVLGDRQEGALRGVEADEPAAAAADDSLQAGLSPADAHAESPELTGNADTAEENLILRGGGGVDSTES